MMSEEKINAVADPETTIERTEPWITEGANVLMEMFFDKNRYARVMETGMGSSTVYFANKCPYFTSIEHDSEWFHKIAAQIMGTTIIQSRGFENGTLFPLHGIQLFYHVRPYNTVIDNQVNNFFDLILIDGRDRAKCTRSAIPKLKSGGWLILDNSERPYYQPGIDLMKGWNRIDCKQEKPDKYGFTYQDWTTSIFIKP